MSSLLAERRTRARVPDELSPELALVCPETRRRARERLPDRDPYAFLAGGPREPDAAGTLPRATAPPLPAPAPAAPVLRLVPVAEPDPRVVTERLDVRVAETGSTATTVRSAQAAAPAIAAPLPAPLPKPTQTHTVQVAPKTRPVPAAPAPRPEVAAAEPETMRATFLAYAGRELAMLGIAAVATLAGLTVTLTIIDVFLIR